MDIKWLVSKAINNKTLRNGGLYSFFAFFNKGVSFLLLIILAKYIQPEQYGELSLYNTLLMLLGLVVGLSTSGYLTSVSFFQKSGIEFKKDFAAVSTITLIVSTLIGIMFFIFQNTLAAWLKLDAQFLFIGLSVAFMTVFVSLNLDYFRVTEKLSSFGILSCGYAILNFILSLYLVIGKEYNWEGRVYAQLICEVIFFCIAIFYFFHYKMFSFNLEIQRYKTIIIWGIPLVFHLASNWLRQGGDRYIIESAHSIGDVGLFSFALNLVGIITMIGTAFNSTNSVSLYQTLSSGISNEEKKRSLIKKEKMIGLIYLLASIIIVVGVCLFVPILIPNYSEALPYFVALSVYGFLNCVYFLFCNYLFYYSKNKQLMYITFFSAVFHLCLSLILTRYSLHLTCLIYVISQAIMTLLVYANSRKLLMANLK